MPTCLRPATLPAISAVVCGLNLGQIVALLFQRRQAAPSFATEATLKTLAAWTPLLAAPDDTKVVKSPEFASGKIPGTAPVFLFENSNDSIDGQGVYVGEDPVKAAGTFLSTPPDIITQLKAYEDESRPGLTNGLTAYLITGDGRIVSSALAGIKITNFHVGSRDLEGFRTLDKNNFGFTLAAGWDRDLVITTPSFDARTQLV